jgi:xanthine dehydrogenase YagT iron-sulfur-binding subunit
MDRSREGKGVSRRGFIATVGAGAAGLALGKAGAGAAEPPREEVVPAGTTTRVRLRVNGREHELLAEPRWTLLYVLREELGLTGAKAGCERGECGACTVLMDGVARYACLTLAVEAQGAEITTLEGLMEGERLGPTQEAFLEHDAFQCGYCTPGQIMAAEGLVRARPRPDDREVRWGMSGNLCRCGAYEHIFQAVRTAARRRRGG